MSRNRDEYRRRVDVSIEALKNIKAARAMQREMEHLEEEFAKFSDAHAAYLSNETLDGEVFEAENKLENDVSKNVATALSKAREQLATWSEEKELRNTTKALTDMKSTMETKIKALEASSNLPDQFTQEAWDIWMKQIDTMELQIQNEVKTLAETVEDLKLELEATAENISNFSNAESKWRVDTMSRLSRAQHRFISRAPEVDPATRPPPPVAPAVNVADVVAAAFAKVGLTGGGATPGPGAAPAAAHKASFPKMKLQEMRKFSGNSRDYPLWKLELGPGADR